MPNVVKFHSLPLSGPVIIETEKNVDVYIDCYDKSPIPNGTIRIIQLQEPIIPKSLFNFVQDHRDRYDYVLTYRDEILTTNEKSRFLSRFGSWVKGYTPKEKKFSVSTVVGGKSDPSMEGYNLRHMVWGYKDQITIPKDFYVSGNSPWKVSDVNPMILGTTKEPLFDSMFHIVIENTSMKNYFTEKIIDCFQTKTVPIYYGCPNISDFFNVNGILVVNSLDELIHITNTLTPEKYNNMLPSIEDNYLRSMNWSDELELLKNAIIKLIR